MLLRCASVACMPAGGTCVRRAPIVCPKPTLAPGYDAMCYKVAGALMSPMTSGAADMGALAML